MKTVLFSTSSLWNCGDDYIRDGVQELLQLKQGVRVLWWNRGFGITNSYANDLKVNLPLMDYFIVAGTPKWIFNNEMIYEYCLEHSVPLSIIGVGTKDFVSEAKYDLLRKVAESGLCEVAMARDDSAYNMFKELGFKNILKMLDPCFFKPTVTENIGPTEKAFHIVGWRDPFVIDGDPKLALRHPLLVAKKLMSSGRLKFAKRNTLKASYDRMFQDYFNALPEAKLVTVHDNREVAPAEKIFGKENVFYSTNHHDLFRLYSRSLSYFGSRIHGAIPAIIHGSPAHLVYTTDKSEVISNAKRIISESYPEFSELIKVDHFSGENTSILPPASFERINLEKLRAAIKQNKVQARAVLKKLPVLSEYLDDNAS